MVPGRPKRGNGKSFNKHALDYTSDLAMASFIFNGYPKCFDFSHTDRSGTWATSKSGWSMFKWVPSMPTDHLSFGNPHTSAPYFQQAYTLPSSSMVDPAGTAIDADAITVLP